MGGGQTEKSLEKAYPCGTRTKRRQREGTVVGKGVACGSDAVFSEGPAGYCHLKRNKIYSI